jgi:hypothetical protein
MGGFMLKKAAQFITVFSFILICTTVVVAQEISNYLIMSNIGDFVASRNPTSGRGPGVVVGADHFYQDHADMTYRISYFNLQTKVGPEIQITQHSGSDSDKWLLHEVEKSFRTSYGIPGDPYAVRVIDGNTVLVYGSAGWTYRWLSGNKIIQIQYRDSQMSKPEPLEVVKAYLVKHPSTLAPLTSADLRTAVSKTAWIKDEMDRRLWLCDKWFNQFQLGTVQQKDVFQAAVENMNVFLNYREKYYGIKAMDDENLLGGYLNTNNDTGIQTKLAEYKTWWTANKGNAVNL